MPAMYKGEAVFGVMGGDGSGNSGGEVYSTEETVIGTWIDGKPLYRKVVTTVTGSVGNTGQVLFSLPDECVIQKWDGYIENAMTDFPGARSPLTYNITEIISYDTEVHLRCSDMVCVFAYKNQLYIRVNPEPAKYELTVLAIVEYTKTTD